MEHRPSSSLEYVVVEVHCDLPSGSLVNLSSDTVEMAFLPEGTAPLAADWKNAEWDAGAAAIGRNIARCLVGPGGPEGTPVLTPGNWQVWTRVHATPEVPVVLVDSLAIT